MAKTISRLYIQVPLLGFALSLCVLHAQPVQAENWKDFFDAGKTAQRHKDYNQALQYYNQALRLAPDNVLIYRMRAEAYQYMNQLQLAEADLLSALQLAPDNAQVYEGLGWLRIYAGKFQAARQPLYQALRLNPNNYWARINLGHTWVLTRAPERAWSIWRPLVHTQLGSHAFHHHLERDIHRLTQRYPSSTADYRKIQQWLYSVRYPHAN